MFTFLINIFSVFNTCIVINIYYKSIKLDHPWIYFVFIQILPKLLLMKNKPRKVINYQKVEENSARRHTSIVESPIMNLKNLNTKLQSDKLPEKDLENKFNSFSNYSKSFEYDSGHLIWKSKKY